MNISQLPTELKLMIVQHCALQSCKALLLVSRVWHQCVLDQSIWEARIKKGYYRQLDKIQHELKGSELLKSLHHNALAAIQEWALPQEPEGAVAYAKLCTIYAAPSTGRQKKLEQFAQESETTARLILSHPEGWDVMQDQATLAYFIEQVMHRWPAAIYYALENPVLRKKWLPFIIPIQHAAHAQAYKKIRNMVRVGGACIAWLWSTCPELYPLLLGMQNNLLLLSKCICVIVRGGDEQVARLWSTHTALLPLLASMVEERPWRLSLCLREIFMTGGEQIVQLWSTDPGLGELLVRIARNPLALFRYMIAIISVGSKQVAQLWSVNGELRNIILNMEDGAFRNRCLQWMINATVDTSTTASAERMRRLSI